MAEGEFTEIELIGGSRVESSRDGPRRSPVATAALLIVLVAAGLVAVAVMVGQPGSEEDASAPDDAPLDEADEADGGDGEADREPETPGLGDASDPTEEHGEYGRPLEATPSSDLVDQQLVTVVGEEFPGNNFIGLAVCSADVLDAHGSGADRCDPMLLGTTGTSGSGSFDAEVRVPRVVHLGSGEWIDCASAPPAGRRTACVLAAGTDWESGRGGFADLHFDPDLEPLRPPALVVEPTTDLLDGQEIVVRVTNADSFEMAEAGLCTRDDMDHGVCHWFPVNDWSLVDVDGVPAWELRSPVPRWLSTHDGQLLDCTDLGCTLSVLAGRWPFDPVVLEFDPIGQ